MGHISYLLEAEECCYLVVTAKSWQQQLVLQYLISLVVISPHFSKGIISMHVFTLKISCVKQLVRIESVAFQITCKSCQHDLCTNCERYLHTILHFLQFSDIVKFAKYFNVCKIPHCL